MRNTASTTKSIAKVETLCGQIVDQMSYESKIMQQTKLKTIRAMDEQVTECANILQDENSTAEQKALSRAILSRMQHLYALTHL